VTDLTLVRSLGFILVAAAALVLVARIIKIPTIVAYILTGLILGPAVGILAATDDIHLISEVGIVLLLFLVGLELSLDKIRDVGKIAVAAGALQIAVTAAAGYGLGVALGFSAVPAAFIAIALTFSSTVVVIKLLEQKKELHSLHGRIAVGILLVQDLAVIVVLTFLAGFGSPEEFSLPSLARGLGLAFVGMALLLALALLAARYVLPRAFGWIASSAEALFIWSLCWCFLLVLTAELLGLSPEIGAFLAGVSLAQLPYSHVLRRRVHPLMNFFIAVFFVSLGIEMELEATRSQLIPAAILSAAVLIGKPALLTLILSRFGYPGAVPWRTGLTLAQISEFSFISASVGVSLGMIDDQVLALIGLTGLATMAVSSYMILYDSHILAAARRSGLPLLRNAPNVEHDDQNEGLVDHVIVVGMNALGAQIARWLTERGETVLAIDTDPQKLAALPCHTLLGNVDYESVLEEAYFSRAKLVVSALQIEDTNNMLAYRCRRAGIPSSIHAFDQSVVDELRSIGVNHLMVSKNDGVKRIAEHLASAGILER
jgi:Kef-type K+ transport system membrane component KefB